MEHATPLWQPPRPADTMPGWRTAVLRMVVALSVLALLIAAVVAVRRMLGSPDAPKRQTARIAILPDTPPPPPPPPPKEEKKPEPTKQELRQTPQPQQLAKPDTPKQAEPLKMEGPAGDGPSAFSAGSVSNDYSGGTPVIGGTGSTGGGGNVADRAQERFYANAVRQLLHDEIEKHLPADAGELTAIFAVWIQPDGSIQRFELVPTGDANRDSALRTAFTESSARLHLPSHGGLPQPMRFKLSMRPA